MHGSRHRLNESGASVIIGTLMIILVVVIGAGSIALMMSTAEKEEMNRLAHQSAVANENLDIDRIVLINGTDPPMADRWVYANFTIINNDINAATVTVTGMYDHGNRTYWYPESVSAAAPGSSWVLYTLMPSGSNPRYADPAGTMLRIPGKKSLDVSINLTNSTNPRLDLRAGDEVRLILYTLLLNTFEERFSPPAPSMKISVESEDLGVAQRDYLLLDGTGSVDDGSITVWNWTVRDDRAGTVKYYDGKTVQARFESPGPFTVNLTVTDDTLMKSSSRDYRVPANPRFNPATALNVTSTLPVITARVTSIDGSNVSSAPVDFLIDANPYGNITLSAYSATTDTLGCANTTVSGGPGRIRIISGDLPPVFVAVS